jgi:hypothetical protein
LLQKRDLVLQLDPPALLVAVVAYCMQKIEQNKIWVLIPEYAPGPIMRMVAAALVWKLICQTGYYMSPDWGMPYVVGVPLLFLTADQKAVSVEVMHACNHSHSVDP